MIKNKCTIFDFMEINKYWNSIWSTILSKNPNIINILINSIYSINWDNLSENWSYLSENPNAIPLLERNIDKINWDILSMNPNAMDLLTQNQEKIHWYGLSKNPNAIFYFRKTKIKTPYKFFIYEKFIIC